MSSTSNQSPEVLGLDPHIPEKQLYTICKGTEGAYSKTFCLASTVATKNHFCKLQLIQKTSNLEYFIFKREGVVGEVGTSTLNSLGNQLQPAVEQFNSACLKKIKDEQFLEVEIACSDLSAQSVAQNPPAELKELEAFLKELAVGTPPAQLDLAHYNLDVLLPLGKLSPGQLKKAKETLHLMLAEYESPNGGDPTKVSKLNDDFYSQVPHKIGAAIAKFKLKTATEVHTKVELIELLAHLQAQTPKQYHVLASLSKTEQWYLKNHIQIVPLKPESEDFKMVHKYFETTKAGKVHKLQQVFRLHHDIDQKRFQSSLGNKKLLWHGTKIEVLPHVLATRLRVPPPDVDKSSSYGKGVYFADMSGYSIDYCSFNTNGIGPMLLCEVALGAEYNAASGAVTSPPAGKHSVVQYGSAGTVPTNETEHRDGYKIPFGLCQTGAGHSASIYVAYRMDQIKLKFLVLISNK